MRVWVCARVGHTVCSVLRATMATARASDGTVTGLSQESVKMMIAASKERIRYHEKLETRKRARRTAGTW